MSAASGTKDPASSPGWFAERFTIFAYDDAPAEPPKDQAPTGSPVRRASLFARIRRLLLPWLGGVSEPGTDLPSDPLPVSSRPKKLIQVDKLEGPSKKKLIQVDKLEGPSKKKLIQVDKLEGPSKWAAGGFSAVTALLLFFGVKEGVLDQAIRQNPFATLCVFILLGVGVLCALFAGAINPVKRIYLWTLLAAIAIMLFLTALFLPNLDAVRDVEDLLNNGSPATEPGLRARVLFWGSILILAGAALALPVTAVRLFVDKSSTTGLQQARDLMIFILSIGILLGAIIFAIVSASRQTLLSVGIGALLLVATAWSFANKPSLPAVAGVIVLGVAATSLGLYGAAKVSVGTKIVAVNPQVSASLEQANGQTFLKIVAVASRMRDEKLLISVSGISRTQELPLRDTAGMTPGEIWQSVLQPNSLDEIDTTVTVPIVPTRWELIWISHCQVAEQRFREGKRTCTHRKEVSLDLRLRNLTPEAGAEITGHIVAASAKSLKVMLTGRSVAWGSQIQAEICRAHNGSHARQLAFATLTPDVTGAVTWNVPVPAGGNGDELILQYRRCPGEDCPDPNELENMTLLAKYVLP